MLGAVFILQCYCLVISGLSLGRLSWRYMSSVCCCVLLPREECVALRNIADQQLCLITMTTSCFAKTASTHRSCCCETSPVPRTRSIQPVRLKQSRLSAQTSRNVTTHQLDLELQSFQGMSAVLPGKVEVSRAHTALENIADVPCTCSDVHVGMR
jgi:hypothetical protein